MKIWISLIWIWTSLSHHTIWFESSGDFSKDCLRMLQFKGICLLCLMLVLWMMMMMKLSLTFLVATLRHFAICLECIRALYLVPGMTLTICCWVSIIHLQEVVLVVFQRPPPGLKCGVKGKHHFFHHCLGGLASMSNETGFMVTLMPQALEGEWIHSNKAF